MASQRLKLERKRAHPIYKLKDGTRVPGASTIAKIGEDSSFLLKWANDLGLQGIDHNKEREEAADAGSVCHFLIQCYLTKREPDLSEFSPKVIEIGSLGFDKFKSWWEAAELSLIACETSLVSEQYKYGGTLDIIAKDKQDKIWLTDQKTSKRIYDSHLFQVVAYERMWNENNPIVKIDKTCIVRIDRASADFEVRPVYDSQKYFNVFLAQLALYNAKRAL